MVTASSMERWNEKVAVVTGASVGIGAAIATQLVKNGLTVIGCSRNIAKIEVKFELISSAHFLCALLSFSLCLKSCPLRVVNWLLGGVT